MARSLERADLFRTLTLISRTGENYFFLTNEERDINKELEQVDLTGDEETKLLGEIIFEEVLNGRRKHRYSANKVDFTFNRLCDLRPVGNRVDGALLVSVVTPLADQYEAYEKGRCLLESGGEEGAGLPGSRLPTPLPRRHPRPAADGVRHPAAK